MRTFSFILLGAATVLAGSAWAATPAVQKEVRQQPSYTINYQQMHAMEGVYALADGRTARLTIRNNRLYAELAPGEMKAMVGVGVDEIASKDGAIRIVFKPQPFGEEIVVGLSAPRAGSDTLAIKDTAPLGGTR